MGSDEVNEGIDRLLEETSAALMSTAPQVLESPPIVDHVAYWMLTTCLSRLAAISLLLRAGHLDDSLPLLRQLMYETHRIMYLAAAPDLERPALALGWQNQQITEGRKLVTKVESSGRDEPELDELKEALRRQQQDFERTRKHLGIESVSHFPAEGEAMIRKLGRQKEDLVNATILVTAFHNTGLMEWLTSESEGRDRKRYIRRMDARTRFGLAELALEWALEAAIAASDLLDGMKPRQRELHDLRCEVLVKLAVLNEKTQREVPPSA